MKLRMGLHELAEPIGPATALHARSMQPFAQNAPIVARDLVHLELLMVGARDHPFEAHLPLVMCLDRRAEIQARQATRFFAQLEILDHLLQFGRELLQGRGRR